MRVLAIVHEDDAGPGVFLDAIRATGAELHSWRFPDEGPPWLAPSDYDAVLTFGGSVHPHEEDGYPWLAEEKLLLAELLDRGVPLLGVCLGAQLVAAAAGALVRRASEPEIGWYRVQSTARASRDPLIGPLGTSFDALEWHSCEFRLPVGATPLASSDACLQAFRVGETAWGIQFHAEVTMADFDSWLASYRTDPDAVALGLEPDKLREQTQARIEAWNELGRGLCARFLDAAAAAGSPLSRGSKR
jgi:GMP synthase (glutamine-hydrolysing)